MTLFSERVVETTTTSGTGTYALAGAATGARTFVAAFGSGATVPYRVQNAANTIWEERLGVVTDADPDTLTRGTLLRSSTGSTINWADSSTKYIYNLPQASVLAGLANGNKGSAAPAWLEAGGTFTDDSATPWIVYRSDGSDLAPEGRIDPTNDFFIPAVGRNLLYNGGMQVAQRGAGPFTSATTPANSDDSYLIDGAILLSDGNDIADIARVANANFASGYAIEIDIETTGKKLAFLFPVENVNIKSVIHAGTASAQFKAIQTNGATIGFMRLHILGWSGTADAITSDVVSAWNAERVNPTMAANWTILGTADFSLTSTIQTCKLDGVAVASSYTNLAVLVVTEETGMTVGHKALIGDVKLEAGPFCTWFEPEPIAAAMTRCQRYFQTYGGTASEVVSAGLAFTSTEAGMPLVFPAPMRVAPTGAVSAAGDWAIRITGSNVAITTFNITSATERSALLRPAVASGLTAGQATYVVASNTSARLTFTAEL